MTITNRTAATKPNLFGGVDYTGVNGHARWAKDDEDIVVYAFDANWVLLWQVRLSAGTPAAVFTATWEAAVADATRPR